MSESVIIEHKFPFSADKIWDALTNPISMKEWYFDIPDFKLEEGAVFNYYEPGDAKEFHHQATILEIVPNKKFKHTWTHPSHSKGVSVLSWELEEVEDGTNLKMTHDGLEQFADAGPAFTKENYEGGWDAIVRTQLNNFLRGMRKKVFKIDIDAPREKVWEIMWDKDSYKEWASVFHEGTYYTGDLITDGKVHFINPNGRGMQK